jgi:glycosyltransferase involved in cell wall biosynthesis
MDARMSRVGVVIPAYNASRYIEETLGSVLGQSRPADEIVVVDDGSTDNTADIAAGVSGKITVLRQKNGGPGSARQRGADAATSEYLLFLDNDDILYSSALEKLSAALLSGPSAALAYCRAQLWSPTNQFPLHDDKLAMPEGKDAWAALLYGNFIRTPGCALIRREALIEVGGWDADLNLKGHDDWDLWLRLAETRPFAPVPESLLKYRLDGTGFSSNRGKMYESMFRVFCKQRSRWKPDPGRRLVIDAGEWDACKRVMKVILHDVRIAGLKGRLFRAIALCLETVRTCARPTVTHVFSFNSGR